MLYKNKNLLWFYRQDNRADLGGFTLLEAGEVFDLPVPGTVTAAAGWSLQADFVRPDDPLWPIDLNPPDHWQCWLHVPASTDRLQVRGRQPGDRFCPLGMGGHTVKIADLMTSSQVPEPIRDRWPLVIVGQEIAWIPGQAISHLFRVEKKIPPILFLKLTRKAAGRGTPID
jgi:tRNA(Ile)-lysidine synthase